MTSIYSWSTSPPANATADESINWQEGQDPGTVNDSARQEMGRVAEFRTDLLPTRVTGGSATAYTATAASAPTSMPNGFVVTFEVHATNTAAATLAVGSYGTYPLRAKVGQDLRAGELIAGTVVTAFWRLATNEWLLVNSGLFANEIAPALIAAAIAAMTPFPSQPQGRLTATAAEPVPVTNVAGGTTVYYAQYVGKQVPIYNGSAFVSTDTGGTLAQALTDTTKSPGAAAASTNYDMFVWNDSGTIRCTRGPAWSSSTARGTGAASTELARVNGLYVNAYAITNGPAAGRGTYVGTIRTNASGTLDYHQGGSNTAARIGIWNAFNRVMTRALVTEPTTSWAYTTSSWRQMNANANLAINVLIGLQEDALEVDAVGASLSTGAATSLSIGYDSTSAPDSESIHAPVSQGTTSYLPQSAKLRKQPTIGWHTVYPLEWGSAGGSQAGTLASTLSRAGIAATMRC